MMSALNQGVGSLIIRLALGLIFFIHGLQKFQGGLDNTAGFFESLGISGIMGYVVATIELVGGILLIVGLGTRWIGAAFTVIMLVAIFTVKLQMGFAGGYEFEIALAAMSLYLVVSGGADYSLDRILFRRGRAAQQ